MTEVEQLHKAATLIRQGHCKGRRKATMVDGKATYCALGALSQAKHGGHNFPIPESLCAFIGETLGLVPRWGKVPTGIDVALWNNKPERTAEDVAQGFCLTAVRLEAQELQS